MSQAMMTAIEVLVAVVAFGAVILYVTSTLK